MCSVAVSEIRQGRKASIEWRIKDWASDFDLLKDNAECTLRINDDKEEGKTGPSALPPVELRFYLKSYDDPDPKPHTTGVCSSWLSLYAEVNWNGGPTKVIVVDVDNTKTTNPLDVRGSRLITKKDRAIIEVQRQFIHLQQRRYTYHSSYGSGSTSKDVKDTPKDPELRFKISAAVCTLFNALDNEMDKGVEMDVTTVGAAVDNQLAEASLARDLALMYGAEENFPDLKLETKDYMTLDAHRFILAARSPVLRKLIEDEVKMSNFSGTLNLPRVTAKSLIVILHWMYTGNLHENLVKVVDQVIEACKMFDMPELLKILDEKLITLCSTDNMLRLYEVAKQNNMMIARETISEFIKKNIDKP